MNLITREPFSWIPMYYPGTVNLCPGCAKSNWHIGRFTAECAFCSTALPLAVFDKIASLADERGLSFATVARTLIINRLAERDLLP